MRWLRTLDFLCPRRLRAFFFVLLVFSVTQFIALASAPAVRHDLKPGQHIAADYNSFWVSSVLLHQGPAAAPYDKRRHEAIQDQQVGHARKDHEGFFYPPPFLLFCWPMSYLPFGWSAAAWLALGAICYAGVVARPQWLAGLAFPPFCLNALYGQNAAFSAAILGGCALLLERAPFAAGLCVSLLICKPQLCPLIPVFLFATRQWRATAGAATGALLLAIATTTAFGPSIWTAWWAHTAEAQRVFKDGLMGFDKMTSLYAVARVPGVGVRGAYLLQSIATVAAAGLIWSVSWRTRDRAMAMAITIACIPLATPFIMDYDLLILSVPLLWLLQRAQTAFLPWEKLGILTAFSLPILLKGWSDATHFPFSALEAPLVLGLLLYRLKFASQPPPSAR